MKTIIDPSTIPSHNTHRLLLSGVAPRPIAFVGTTDIDGRHNLAPFSFFNAFGVNPPVVCFSPAFSGKTGAPKDTLLNILETKECTISIVSYSMVHQVSIASAPFERGVDEFVKAGFTKYPSSKVSPPGVAESPFIMEAKLLHHIEFGGKPGSANMLICEIVMFHINSDLLNDSYIIDPHKLDQVARMGGSWYTRAVPGLFELRQPGSVMHGYDSLPESIKVSHILSSADIHSLLEYGVPDTALSAQDDPSTRAYRHSQAQQLIADGKIADAWRILLS